MHRLEHLRELVQKGDADRFARELGLDPRQTRQWFDQNFTTEGYGAEVIRVLGTHVVKALTTAHDEHREHD